MFFVDYAFLAFVFISCSIFCSPYYMFKFEFVFLISSLLFFFFFFSSRRRHTRWTGDWSSDVCSSDLSKLKCPWLVSYDSCPEILRHYSKRKSFRYDLQYNASSAYKGTEVFIASDNLDRKSVV